MDHLGYLIKSISLRLIVMLLHLEDASGSTLTDLDNLYTNVILATDHRYRPKVDQNTPIYVEVKLHLLSVMDISEVRQSLSTNILLSLVWTDEIRTWNPLDYNGINIVYPEPLDIWRPRMFLSNSVGKRDVFEDDYAPITLYSNGTIEWSPGGIVHTSCDLVMTYFPFDRQECSLIFLNGADSKHMMLQLAVPYVSLDLYRGNGEWEIESSTARSVIRPNNDEIQPLLNFAITFRRRPSYLVLSLTTPIVIISSLSNLVFIMPVESGERLSFSVTVLLSITVYTGEISKQLPNNSESLPLFMIYMVCILVHCTFTIAANIFVLMRYHRLGLGSTQNSPASVVENSGITNFKFDDDFVSFAEMSGHTGYSSPPTDTQFRRHEDKKIPKERDRVKDESVLSGENNKQNSGFCGFFRKAGLCGVTVSSRRNALSEYLSSVMSRVLIYVSLLDFVLFVLSTGVWLVLTSTFSLLIIFGGD